jgi:hypothetical protein
MAFLLCAEATSNSFGVAKAPLFQLLVIMVPQDFNVFLHGRLEILGSSLVKMLRVLDGLHNHEVTLESEYAKRTLIHGQGPHSDISVTFFRLLGDSLPNLGIDLT